MVLRRLYMLKGKIIHEESALVKSNIKQKCEEIARKANVDVNEITTHVVDELGKRNKKG